MAEQVNKPGRFEAVIHDAGREKRVETEPGVPSLFAVNVLTLRIVMALIERPDRLAMLAPACVGGWTICSGRAAP